MICVKMHGGLGNQMFLYAAAKGLGERLNTEPFFDLSDYPANESSVRGESSPFRSHFELEHVFPIRLNRASPELCSRYPDGSRRLRWGRYLGAVLPHLRHEVLISDAFRWKISVDRTEDFLRLRPDQDIFLDGFFQGWRYVEPARQTVLRDFAFSEPEDSKNREFLRELRSDGHFVSVHVRRGDFLSNEGPRMISPIEYYEHALKVIRERVDSPKFAVFSDDIGWCRDNLKIPDAVFVDWNHGMTSFRDMQLIAACSHHIASNSTFSWWGAYLGRNPAKVICITNRWFPHNRSDHAKIWAPPDWIVLD